VGACWFSGVRLGRFALRTFVDGGVGVTELDGYAPPQFLAVSSCPNTCYCLYQCGFSVIHMADGSDVNFWLTRDSYGFFWQFLFLQPQVLESMYSA